MNVYKRTGTSHLWPFGFLIAALLFGVCYQPPLIGQGRGGGQGGGHGGGGGPGEEVAPNNLSVPAILVNGNPFGVATGADIDVLVAPEQDGIAPLSGYPIAPSAFYYVQGVHYWQASCIELDPAGDEFVSPEVTAHWGDNLTGEAALKTNSPIRVEVGLVAVEPEIYEAVYETNWIGWMVEKLEPDKLDREAAYGTLASGSQQTEFTSNPVSPYLEVRVYDDFAWLRIYNTDNPQEPIVDEPASAEINSTGRIVYGYNLRVETVGTYVIEFTAPNVDIDGADSHTITLEIEVTAGSGGGGGGSHGGGGSNQGNKGGGGPPDRD